MFQLGAPDGYSLVALKAWRDKVSYILNQLPDRMMSKWLFERLKRVGPLRRYIDQIRDSAEGTRERTFGFLWERLQRTIPNKMRMLPLFRTTSAKALPSRVSRTSQLLLVSKETPNLRTKARMEVRENELTVKAVATKERTRVKGRAVPRVANPLMLPVPTEHQTYPRACVCVSQSRHVQARR